MSLKEKYFERKSDGKNSSSDSSEIYNFTKLGAMKKSDVSGTLTDIDNKSLNGESALEMSKNDGQYDIGTIENENGFGSEVAPGNISPTARQVRKGTDIWITDLSHDQKKLMNSVNEKDAVHFHENIITLTMLCYLKSVQEKYMLTRARQAQNLWASFFIIIIQLVMLTLTIIEIV